MASFMSLPKVAIASPRNVRCEGGNSNGCGDGWRRSPAMKLTREELLMKLGSARSQTPTALASCRHRRRPPRWQASPTGSIARELAQARRREGRYLLRTNLYRQRPGEAVGTLSDARQNPGSLQDSQKRSRTAADLPSTRGSDRGAYLHRFPCLLFARHAEKTPARARPGPHHEAFWKNLPPCR